MTTRPAALCPAIRASTQFQIFQLRARSIASSRYVRQLKFVAVGGVCFLLQIATLIALLHVGVADGVANAMSFLILAEVKFVLSSRLVWNDPACTKITWRGFAWFNITTLVIFFVDQLVFIATDRVLTSVPAAILGVVAGTIISYIVCDRVIFRSTSERRLGKARELT